MATVSQKTKFFHIYIYILLSFLCSLDLWLVSINVRGDTWRLSIQSDIVSISSMDENPTHNWRYSKQTFSHVCVYMGK